LQGRKLKNKTPAFYAKGEVKNPQRMMQQALEIKEQKADQYTGTTGIGEKGYP
jgi:hypothetical protein